MSTIFFLGLLIRICLIFWRFSFDINNHISWTQDLAVRGFSGFYQTISKEVYCCLYPNYPPLILYIFYPFYFLKQLIFNFFWWLNIHISFFPSNIIYFLDRREFLAGLFKIPAIISDLGLAYIMYLFAKKIVPKNKKIQLLASILILLSPIFFYTSGLWGQVDSIPIFLFLISIYLLIYQSKPILSSLFFVLAILVKPTIFIFLPIYAVYYFKKFGWKKIIQSFLIGNLIFWLSFLPFYKNGNMIIYPYITYFQKIINNQSMANVSNSAFNFWLIFPVLMKTKDIVKIAGLLSYQITGFIIVVIFYLIITSLYLKKTRNITIFFYSLFISGLSYLMFSTRMHERYFIYLLPPLLLVSFKENKFLKWYLIASFMFFLNLYYSWSVPYADWVGVLKNNMTISILSIINFVLFIFFLVNLFKFKTFNNKVDNKR